MLAAILLLPGIATAAPDWRDQIRTDLHRPSISVEQCANLVRRETGGRVLSVTPARRGDRGGCEVRVLVDGKRVKNYFVDDSGNIRSRD